MKVLAQYDTTDDVDGELFYDFKYDVEQIIKKFGIKNWFAYGLALTWRNVAGYCKFTTTDARTFINKLAPNCNEWSMKIMSTKDNKRQLTVVLTHHDKPMGETLWVMSQRMAKAQRIEERHF